MFTMENLKNHPYAACYVRRYDDGRIDFISYATRVITVKNGKNGREVECTGTYSRTTAKQIGWFCNEYMHDMNYYDIKGIAGKGFVTR